MAPEFLRNYYYGPHIYISALGCTIYELITGTPLLDEDDDQVLQKIAFEKPKFQN
ncbi:hypothetical protein MTR67_030984 [Solanum verrucosum]|uniref:Protein kinase domain-containing protein n=1 Tax=Solanum verrucosum TaxID=315347 RepID=A0AAF0U1R4_SOLVR|nr:hypothetical protein MTR67_030984 [Solanum verrucosum]